MRSYNNKQELIDSINGAYKKYIAEFSDVSNDDKNKRIEGVDKTPSENLAYQLGWTNLLLKWEKDEMVGKDVQTPAPGYKWNNLGGLYKSFYDKYGKYSIEEQVRMLDDNVDKLNNWINSLTEQELFEPNHRKWATTQAKWPIWKWIHINTVAPFTTFRAKIRKWKKLA